MPSFVISGSLSLIVLLLTSIAGVLNEFADGPRDTGIANALSAFANGLQALSSQAASVTGNGEVSHHPDPSTGPAQTPAIITPIPNPGERSEAYAARYPAGLVCDIPPGMKRDPWHVLQTPSGYVRGAWIPVDATYTLPVDD